jgi:hypothetical protein
MGAIVCDLAIRVTQAIFRLTASAAAGHQRDSTPGTPKTRKGQDEVEQSVGCGLIRRSTRRNRSGQHKRPGQPEGNPPD